MNRREFLAASVAGAVVGKFPAPEVESAGLAKAIGVMNSGGFCMPPDIVFDHIAHVARSLNEATTSVVHVSEQRRINET